MDHKVHTMDVDYKREYIKFAGIVIGLAVVSALLSIGLGSGGLENFFRTFMGLLFLVFALFKFLDPKGFAMGFRSYDLIASRIKAYAYLYPIIELWLAYLYLFNLAPMPRDIFTLAFLGISAAGVLKQLSNPNHIPCVCFGTVIKLPLNYVSLSEYLVMGAMVVAMLVL